MSAKQRLLSFESKRTECPPFTLEGQVQERVEVFKYLGIAFHGTRGLSCAMEHSCNSARKSLFALYGRCHELHIVCPALQCSLFDALVRPVTYWVTMDHG